MLKVLEAVRDLLMGRKRIELELARGIILSVLYPAPHLPALSDAELEDDQIPRQFWEVFWYAPNPLIIGEG